MNTQHLYYFKSLAKYEHYGNAAKENLTSASSLSYAISTLEEELGVSLFVKSGRNIRLTFYGEIFLEYVNNIINTYEKCLKEINDISKDQLSNIRLISIDSLSTSFIGEILKDFNLLKHNSKIRFKLFTGTASDTVVDAVKNGKCKFGFCNRIEDPNIINYTLFKEEFVLISPKNRYQFVDRINDFSVFNDANFVAFNESYPMYWSINQIYQSYNFHPKILYNASSDIQLLSFVENGLGPAITLNSEEVKNANVDVFKLDKLFERDFSFIWLQGTDFNKNELDFKKFVINYFNNKKNNDHFKSI